MLSVTEGQISYPDLVFGVKMKPIQNSLNVPISPLVLEAIRLNQCPFVIRATKAFYVQNVSIIMRGTASISVQSVEIFQHKFLYTF